MSVDEAIEEARRFGEQEPKDMLFAEHIAIELAGEVERLRAKLAAAKAASVWPVGWTEIRTNPGGNVVIYTENHEIAFQLMAWLRDRMKDTTPPEA